MKNIFTDKDIRALASKVAERISENVITPRWMTLRQAAKYSNIGEQRLKTMAKAKEIKGAQDNTGNKAWFFDRNSIDAYHEASFKEGVTDATIKKLLANSDKYL